MHIERLVAGDGFLVNGKAVWYGPSVRRAAVAAKFVANPLGEYRSPHPHYIYNKKQLVP